MASREFGTFRIDADVDSDDEQEKFSNLRLDVEVRTAPVAVSSFALTPSAHLERVRVLCKPGRR